MARHARLQRYDNVKGSSGVSRFGILAEGIIVEFSSGQAYLYSYQAPGFHEVEAMKQHALCGDGLATYINQHVRERYEKRLW